MQIKRIEIEGSHGTLTIERDRRSRLRANLIRIDSIIRDPQKGEETWKTWKVESNIDPDALFKVAEEAQRRTDGVRGTGSDIHEYFTEMQRFVD